MNDMIKSQLRVVRTTCERAIAVLSLDSSGARRPLNAEQCALVDLFDVMCLLADVIERQSSDADDAIFLRMVEPTSDDERYAAARALLVYVLDAIDKTERVKALEPLEIVAAEARRWLAHHPPPESPGPC